MLYRYQQTRVLVAMLCALFLVLPSADAMRTGHRAPQRSPLIPSNSPPSSRVRAAVAHLPVAFEPNEGQNDPAIHFLTHGPNYTLALTKTEALLALVPLSSPSRDSDSGENIAPSPASTLQFRFLGANPNPVLQAEQPLSGIVNSFIGNDPAHWRTNIPTSAQVRYRDLYPGLDLVMYGTEGSGIEYDVIVAPGADPAMFALSIGGATAVMLDAGTGDLVLMTEAGEVRQHAPVIYQDIAGTRRTVPGGYELREDGTIGFAVGAYDRTAPLVIDPTLAYATYLGGSGQESGNGIAVDANGNAYVTGDTDSANFPVTNGSTASGNLDVFVTKLDGTGARIYSTIFGGNYIDEGSRIVLDANDDAYVVGSTRSANFPVTNGSTLNGLSAAFVTKLSATGAPVYSEYLSGNNFEEGYGIAVDGSSNAYIVGQTQSINFPVTNGSTYGGGQNDAFVAKLNASGVRVFSTFLGGSDGDSASSIALDTSGNMYITGSTASPNFPVTNGSTLGGSGDAFVTKLNGSGTRIYSTYLGGSDFDGGSSIAVDTSGNVYITGQTQGPNFPVTNGSTFGGLVDAFVAKLDASGTRMYSGYLGGTNYDVGGAIAVDASGNAYVMGYTQSTNFPTTNGSTLTGFHNVFVTKLDGTGILLFSTYVGGTGSDNGTSFALDASASNAYITGQNLDGGFPVTNGSTYNGGFSDAFVAKLVFSAPLTISPITLPSGMPLTAYRQVLTSSGGTAPYVFTVTSGTLPPGLTFTATGTLSGTPLSAGSFTFTVTVTDHAGLTGNRTYTVTVGSANSLPTQRIGGPNNGAANTLPAPRPTVPATGGVDPIPQQRP